MSGPIRSDQSNNVNPYDDLDGWLNEDTEANSTEGLRENISNQGASDEFIADDGSGETGEGALLSVSDTLQNLKESSNQLREQLHDKTLDKTHRTQLIEVLKKATDLIHQLTALKTRHIEEVPVDLEQQINDVELAASPAGAEEVGDENSSTSNITDAISELKTKIKGSDRLPDSKKSELISKLDRAKSNLDLNPGDASIESATNLVSEVQQEFDTLSAMSKAAVDLASKLQLNPEEIQSAAQNAGVNLDNLPKPPNDKVMNMLKELNIPDSAKLDEFNQIKDERKTKMADLKQKLSTQDQEWHSETENPPSKDDFNNSFKYWKKEDDLFKQLQSKEEDMRSTIVDALNALGYQASAGTSSDQISVNGSILDFYDEKTGNLGFNSSLSDLGLIQTNEDFYPSPKNTESDSENNIWDITPDGYPKIQYTVD